MNPAPWGKCEAFVTPSLIAGKLAVRFDSLNPYSVPVPLLKDRTEEKAPRLQQLSEGGR